MYIKLDASQSGPFTNNYNNIDFDIPDADYDFSSVISIHIFYILHLFSC